VRKTALLSRASSAQRQKRNHITTSIITTMQYFFPSLPKIASSSLYSSKRKTERIKTYLKRKKPEMTVERVASRVFRVEAIERRPRRAYIPARSSPITVAFAGRRCSSRSNPSPPTLLLLFLLRPRNWQTLSSSSSYKKSYSSSIAKRFCGQRGVVTAMMMRVLIMMIPI